MADHVIDRAPAHQCDAPVRARNSVMREKTAAPWKAAVIGTIALLAAGCGAPEGGDDENEGEPSSEQSESEGEDGDKED
jgi:hypothetical protein